MAHEHTSMDVDLPIFVAFASAGKATGDSEAAKRGLVLDIKTKLDCAMRLFRNGAAAVLTARW